MKINIAVLNYNGLELLKKNLPGIVEASRFSKHDCRVTVVDNSSDDGSVEYLKDYHGVSLFQSKNRVLCSYNRFAMSIDDEVMILLNSDVSVEHDFVDPLIEPFERYIGEKIFFTTFINQRTELKYRFGAIEARYSAHQEREVHTFSAGMGAFNRKKFLELGGYDTLYLPGYYEDVDLCYRASKKGWIGVYVPSSRALHSGGGTFNKFYGKKRVDGIVFRNSILFMIKNEKNVFRMAIFLLLLPLRLIFSILRGKWFLVMGFIVMFDKLGLAMRKRGLN